MKKLFLLILVFVLSLSIIACNSSDKNNDELDDGSNDIGEVCTSHTDNDGDKKCDNCGTEVEPIVCTEHTDANGDEKCDNCGTAVAPTMCTEHTDLNGDGKCDVCGEVIATDDSNGLLLVNSVIAQLEKTESVKAEIELSIVTSNDEWYYSFDERTYQHFEENYKNYIKISKK